MLYWCVVLAGEEGLSSGVEGQFGKVLSYSVGFACFESGVASSIRRSILGPLEDRGAGEEADCWFAGGWW